MFNEALKSLLLEEFPEIRFDEPLKKHTTMAVGGPCDGFLNVCAEDVPKAVEFCRVNNIPVFILGNGSNTIGTDKGYRGLVICTGRKMNQISVNNVLDVEAYAGAKLSAVAEVAATSGIGGFEFLAGIPGNLGGAIVMNAGAYGGEIKNLIKTVTFYENGKTRTESGENLNFGYRKSYFMKHPETIILSAQLSGVKKEEKLIREEMADYAKRRSSSQPLEFPSSGSFFKRPEGYFAGKLIQDSGLKGYTVGGAAISEKHAGFVINKGGATYGDIKSLSDHVKKCVMDKFGVLMEHEVRFLGDE